MPPPIRHLPWALLVFATGTRAQGAPPTEPPVAPMPPGLPPHSGWFLALLVGLLLALSAWYAAGRGGPPSA